MKSNEASQPQYQSADNLSRRSEGSCSLPDGISRRSLIETGRERRDGQRCVHKIRVSRISTAQETLSLPRSRQTNSISTQIVGIYPCPLLGSTILFYDYLKISPQPSVALQGPLTAAAVQLVSSRHYRQSFTYRQYISSPNPKRQ